MKKKQIEPESGSFHNLRPVSERKQVYRPIGMPRKVTSRKLELLATLPGGDVVVSDPEGTYVMNPADGEMNQIDVLRSENTTVVTDGRLVAMTSDGPVMFESDGAGGVKPTSGGVAEWSPISIVAEAGSPVRLNIERTVLSREYDAGETVDVRDAEAVEANIAAAYRRVDADTRREGVFFMPLIARAKVLDAKGNVLYQGPEILVTGPNGDVFGRSVTFEMSDRRSVEPLSMDIDTYRLRVTVWPVVSQSWAERARSVAIEVSPCFHTYRKDVTRDSATVTVNRGTGNGTRLTASWPGRDTGLSFTGGEGNRRRVEAVLKSFDEYAMTATVEKIDFTRGGAMTVTSHGIKSVDEQQADMAAMTERYFRGAPTVDHDIAALNVPHTFTARQMVATPTTVCYGGITPLPFAGYSPADFAAETDGESAGWEAETTVTYEDGSVSRRRTAGTGHKPLKLGPLVSHPDATATRIDFVVEDSREGVAPLSWHVDLSPDASGRRAIGLTTDVTERTPARGEKWITSSGTQRRRVPMRPGLIAIAKTGEPLKVTAAVDTGSTVTALVAARSSAAAWDFGRTRFNAFTTDKVILVNANSDRTTVVASTLADTGAPGRHSVTTTETGEVFFVNGSETVYKVDGGHVGVVARLNTEADRIEFDRTAKVLTTGDSEGSYPLQHVDIKSGRTVMTSTSPGRYDSTIAAGSYVLAATDDGISDMAIGSRTTFEGTAYVRMRLRYGPAVRTRSITPVEAVWDIESGYFDGTLSVDRSFLIDKTATISRYKIAGGVRTPIALRFSGRPFARLETVLEAQVTADTRIGCPTLTL